MNYGLLLAPIVGYLAAGSIKFLLNSIRTKRLAINQLGMGGMPSTHNTITSSTFFVIGFSDGFNSGAAAVGLALTIIVALDSMDLRKKISTHAALLQEASEKLGTPNSLRLRVHHSPAEVACGFVLGAAVGYCSFYFVQL